MRQYCYGIPQDEKVGVGPVGICNSLPQKLKFH